jgi:hypothetical protein
MRTKTLIISILISVCLNAQSYKSCFGKYTTTWNICGTNEIRETRFYNLTGDTTIDTIVYKTTNFRYNLREDTLTGKLFVIADWEAVEHVVMDLSLNVNDTFFFSGIKFHDFAIVDSIYYINTRKYIEFDYPIDNFIPLPEVENLTFIEGIGPNIGFTYLSDEFMWNNTILLCYTNDSFNYINENYDTCDINWVNIEQIQLNEIQLYPNPVSDFLNIKNAQNLTICIYNLYGQVVSEKEVTDNPFKYSVNELINGVYIAKFRSTNGAISYNKVFIKTSK